MTITGSNGTFGVSLLAGAGSILGLPAVFANEPYSMTAELVLDSELAVLSCGLLLDHTSKHADFALRVLRLLGEEVQAARRVRVGTPHLRRKLLGEKKGGARRPKTSLPGAGDAAEAR